MAYSFDDLTRPMTRQEVQAAIYAGLAATGVSTTGWKRGAVVRTMAVVVSSVFAAFTVLTSQIARSGFLELSSGDWLTIVARYVYGVDRELASFATGEVTLDNTGGGVYVMGVGDLLVTSPTTGKSYRNTVAFTLDALQHDLPPVAISAVELGSASSAAAGTVTKITTLPVSVTCTNLAAFGARDQESDGELRARAYESLGQLSPMGPWDAYNYAIKTARRDGGLGAPIGVTRVKLDADGYGNVTVHIANPTGPIDPSDVAIAQAAVDRKAEPQAVTATVVSATAKVINIVHETWAYNTSSQSPGQIEVAIYSRLRDYLQTQPIGGNVIPPAVTGKVYGDALRAVIGASLPSLIVHTELTSPAGDVELGAGEVPVLGTVSTTLHQIPTPEGHAP